MFLWLMKPQFFCVHNLSKDSFTSFTLSARPLSSFLDTTSENVRSIPVSSAIIASPSAEMDLVISLADVVSYAAARAGR